MSESYFLHFRPCVEILAVSADVSSTFGVTSTSRLTSNSVLPLYNGASETDLIGLVASISSETYQALIRQWNSRQSSKNVLLLLGTGGVFVYLLYNRSLDQDSISLKRGQHHRPRPRWRSRGWLWWLFGSREDEQVVETFDQSLLFQGSYFGPENISILGGRSGGRGKKGQLFGPCPNCSKGSCRIRKHHFVLEVPSSTSSSSYSNSPLHNNNFTSQPLPTTSTPDFADDEASEDGRDHFHKRFFRSGSVPKNSRLPPLGKDKFSPICGDEKCVDPYCYTARGILEKDETMDSIKSVSGSMVDLVKGAREIRKLIREASMDSIASDLNVDFNEDIGQRKEFSSIERELTDLQKNCSAMNVRCESLEVSSAKMSTSKSDYTVNNPSLEDSSKFEGSVPNMKLLQRPSQQFWKVTNFDSPFHSSNSSTRNPSPLNEWYKGRYSKRTALSSQSTSECGGDLDEGWEWDSEEFQFKNEYITPHMLNHHSWLPENVEKLELDLETELNLGPVGSSSTASTRNGSRRTSCDSSVGYYANKVRLPPSGRSSVDKGSGDTPRESINHEALVKSFGVYPNMEGSVHSVCSTESGFQEGVASLESSTTSSSVFTTSGVTLSPVHEVKEEVGTPIKKSDKKGLKKKQLKFGAEEDESDVLKVVVNAK